MSQFRIICAPLAVLIFLFQVSLPTLAQVVVEGIVQPGVITIQVQSSAAPSPLVNPLNPEEMPKTPAILELEKFLQKCDAYLMLAEQRVWRLEHQVDFTQQTEDKIKEYQPVNVRTPALLEAAKVEAQTVLRVVPAAKQRSGYMDLKQKITGWYAVEAKIRADAQNPGSVAITSSYGNSGPGMQLPPVTATELAKGALWLNINAQGQYTGGQFILNQYDVAAGIPSDRWCVVRLEVRDNMVTAMLDQKVVMQQPLYDQYLPRQALQPMLYVFNGGCLVSEVKIETYVVLKQDLPHNEQTQILRKVFGEITTAQFEKQLQDKLKLLDDPDWSTREWAERLLPRAGSLIVNPLKELTTKGTTEQKDRAPRLLARITAIAPATDDKPTRPAEPLPAFVPSPAKPSTTQPSNSSATLAPGVPTGPVSR